MKVANVRAERAMMAKLQNAGLSAPPVSELGTSVPFVSSYSGQIPGISGGPGVGAFIDSGETVPELMWPMSPWTYDRMRNDEQITALYMGTSLPIINAEFKVDPRNSSPDVYRPYAQDLGLKVLGEEDRKQNDRLRNANRFSMPDHIAQALLMLIYGHMPFEQVGRMARDGKPGNNGGWMWHLDKLSARMPKTIGEIYIAGNGDLVSFKQMVGVPEREIPVDRTVWYAWQMEGSNWIGRSALRSLYRNWMIKDALRRCEAVGLTRTGMGIPITTSPPNATADQEKALAYLAMALRQGENSGGNIPNGAQIKLMGVEGRVNNPLPTIQDLDQGMARAWMMQWIMLAQTSTGSRSLGETFIDEFGLILDAILNRILRTFNAGVTEDWVDWNFGPNENAPCVVANIKEETELAATDLVNMVTGKVITPTPKVQAWAYNKYGIPYDADEIQEFNDAQAAKAAQIAAATPAPTTDPTDPNFDPSKQPKATTPNPDQPNPVSGNANKGAPIKPENRNPNNPLGKSKASDANHGTGNHRASAAARQTPVKDHNLAMPDRALRRNPMPFEVRAAVNFKKMDSDWNENHAKVLAAWKSVQSAQIMSVKGQLEQIGNDIIGLQSLSVPVAGADALASAMKAVAREGAKDAAKEAANQGVTLATPDWAAVDLAIENRANSIAATIAEGLRVSAMSKAESVIGGSLNGAQIASTVANYMTDNLSTDAGVGFVSTQIAGAITAGQNEGRRQAMGDSPDRLYASEILDVNTCDACQEEDGEEFASWDDAGMDYPTGLYKECAGGDRCRGAIIAVYNENNTDNDTGLDE